MKKFLSIMLAVMLVLSFAACSKVAEPEKTNSDGASPEESSGTSYDNLAIACELTSEEYGIGFRKGSDLTAEVNKIMDELIADGTLGALAEEYELTLADADDAQEYDATVSDLEYVKEKGELIIGITDYEPMNYRDADGNWTGFDTEFAEAVCAKLGVKATFLEIEWDSKFLSLDSKVIDCIWNGMTISEEVLANTSCSKAYVKNAQVLVITKDKAEQYKDPSSIKDLTVAVEAGSAGFAAAEEFGVENIVEVTAQTDAVLEVTSKSCDACIIDLTMANAMLGTK